MLNVLKTIPQTVSIFCFRCSFACRERKRKLSKREEKKLIAKNLLSDPTNLSSRNASNGNGLSASSTDKESLTPSPPNRMNDNVKSEPIDLVCNQNLPSDEQSNDSIGDHDGKYLGGIDGKGSLR